jgi:UDP-N-acetylmuramoylalanine--D-glutamate ligase
MHFLLKKGASVFLSESKAPVGETLPKGVRAEFGGHTTQALEADLIIPSPGISGHSPLLVKAKRLKIPVISEIELASSHCPGTIIGITGSNGKSGSKS